MARRRRKGLRLNDQVVTGLPFKRGQYTVWDLTTENVGVRVSGATKSCVISVRLGKGRKFRTVGPITPDSPYEYLREVASKQLLDFKRSRLPKTGSPGLATLRDALDLYIGDHPELKESTADDYRQRISRVFENYMDQPIARLSREEILRLNRERLAELKKQDPINVPPKGYWGWNSVLRLLRAVVRWYAELKGLTNPWPDRRALPLGTPPARELPVELQCAAGRRRLIEGLKAIDGEAARACQFLCFTGFRRGEGTAMSPAHLIAPRVLEFQSKTRKLRVPLSNQALALIDKSSPDTLLRSSGGACREPLRRIFGMRKTPRGMRSRVTPHDLRRYFKSVATELGIDPTVRNILVGHSIPNVDKSYIAKLRLAVLLEATQKIADEIENPHELPGEDELLGFTDEIGARPAASDPAAATVLGAEPGRFYRRAKDYLSKSERPELFVHYLAREELHKIVWTAPVCEVSTHFGISDVGLAKICRRASIPIPPRGYWAKIASGHHIAPTGLPPPPRGLPEMIRIRGAKPPPEAVAQAA